jgi:AcrR family transcriptional regulator
VDAPAEDLSLRSLADRAGVTPRAPYAHFPDKKALLKAIALRGFRQMAAEMREGSLHPVEIGECYIRLAVNYPHLFRLMFSGVLDATECEPHEDPFQLLLQSIRNIRPSLSEDEVRVTAVALWAFVHGIADLRLENLVPDAFWNEVTLSTLARSFAETALKF